MRKNVDSRPTAEQVTAVGKLLVDLVDGAAIDPDTPHLDPTLVGAHGLAPLAYRYGVYAFKPAYLATALQAEVRARRLAEATAVLTEAQIPIILLKGMAYVQDLYDDPAERPMTDIDLMVPVEKHAAAVEALEGIGYRHGSKLGQRAEVHHAMTLSRRDGDLDLHRRIIQPMRSAIDLDAVWERSVPVPGLEARRPDPVDETIFHMTHVGRHEMNVAAISYIDGHRLLTNLDSMGLMPELERRARTYRIARLVRVACQMTNALCRGDQVLDIPQPWRALLPSPREILEGILPPRPLQLARKAALTEGPRELMGLAAVFALTQAERLRRS